ncbi:MAG: FkbM family methyltransferase [Desulfuromonadales bacterium]
MAVFSSLNYILQVFVFRKRFLTKKLLFKTPVEFKVAAKDVIGRTIFKKGGYDTELTNYILDHIEFSENDVFIDVGANIGWYSILVGKNNPFLNKVVAFEPDPFNFTLLQENIKKNEGNKVLANKIAVSDKVSTATLYKYSEHNLGRHSLLPINDGERLEVKTTTLDDYWDEHMSPQDIPRLIKIDTEGYEYNVVLGAGKLLEKGPVVLAEFSPRYMQRGGVKPADFISLMQGHGYSPHKLEGGVLESVELRDLEDIDGYINLFWLQS